MAIFVVGDFQVVSQSKVQLAPLIQTILPQQLNMVTMAQGGEVLQEATVTQVGLHREAWGATFISNGRYHDKTARKTFSI